MRNWDARPGDFPITEQLAQTVLSLPMGPHLLAEQLQTVIQAIRAFKA